MLAGALAVVLAAGLAAHTAHRPDGFLPRSLVGNRPFALSAFAGFTLFAGYLIVQFAAPPPLLGRHDLTATQIGLIFLPTGLASAALSNYGGRLAARVSPLRIAAVLAAASTAALALAGLSPVPLLVDPPERGIATGVFQRCSSPAARSARPLSAGCPERCRCGHRSPCWPRSHWPGSPPRCWPNAHPEP